MAPDLLATYLVAITLLTLTPGLDTLLVVRNTARGGWRDGAVSSLGICSGLFVHAAVSALGISVILVQAAWAFGALKLAGAAYLVWLGLASWRRVLVRGKRLAEGVKVHPGASFRLGRSLREGVLSNVLNPKAAIFYMAFLPQFIDPAGSALLQALFLASLHFAIAMVWLCLLALGVRQSRNLFARPRLGPLFDGLTGSVLLLLGVRVALDR